MLAVRRLSRTELQRRLAPYRCRKRADIAPLIELWVTGWDEPFTLCPDDEDYFDEFVLQTRSVSDQQNDATRLERQRLGGLPAQRRGSRAANSPSPLKDTQVPASGTCPTPGF
jgi:hypothetical protein